MVRRSLGVDVEHTRVQCGKRFGALVNFKERAGDMSRGDSEEAGGGPLLDVSPGNSPGGAGTHPTRGSPASIFPGSPECKGPNGLLTQVQRIVSDRRQLFNRWR